MGVKNVPLINGQEYNHAQIMITVAGVQLWGVSSINYGTEQTKENQYGAGDFPVSRGSSAKVFSGDIELLMTEVEKLRDVAPAGDLTNLPAFDIVVSYLNEQKPVTDRLIAVEFTDDSRGSDQGNTGISNSFNLVYADIEHK